MAKKSSRVAQDSIYDVHPAVAYVGTIIENLPSKTGKSIQQWVRLAGRSKYTEERELRSWLKSEYQLGGTTAAIIAEHTLGDTELHDPNAYLSSAAIAVDKMYAGKKCALRPIHDALIDLGKSLGKDVRVCPCKTMVPLYRKHVFAEIKPATQKRVDFGLALKGVKRRIPKRLAATGGLAKGDRITHRFALESVADIDKQVHEWLRLAYEMDAAPD